ncbi:hypothetical protein C7M84_005197 [Penaeus vannamei]|uniref:RNA-directed DNA polymerase n=1 Tax=Penaeus vannamei TaxID=6689 RepID=A0A423UAW7_PENVA|nr:hypothetical protein C7M84_005197 [Penaeus vannamei]
MVKREAVTHLPGVHLHASSRALQGVSGQPTPAVAEVDLPFTWLPWRHLDGYGPVTLLPCPHGPRRSLFQELRGVGCHHRISFTRGGTTGYHVPACHDGADETPEAVEVPELSQSPSLVAVSPVHVAEETVVEARSGKFVAATVTCSSPDDTRLAIVETCTDRLTVPRTLVTVQGRRSSVWVVNPPLKPRKVRPGTVLGYASFLEPEVVCTVPASAMTSDTPDSKPPAERLMATATPDLEQEEFSEKEEFLHCGEFQDDDYHSTACLDFGYEDEDFFVFPDTPALDEACQQEELEAACAAVDSGTGGTEAVGAPLPIALGHLTADQEGQLREVLDRFPTLFSGDKLAVGHVPGVQHRDASPPAEKACPLEQDQEAREDAADPLDLTRMTAEQMREHQLQDSAWVHRTSQNLQGAWYFPNMHRLAREYVARCHACQQRKGVADRAPMEGHPLPEAPLVRVSADLMDLRGSTTGFRYVLSIVDHHTRFIQLVPLCDKSANRVLRAFVDHYVTLFGPPDHLHTGNGLEFSSDEWRSLLEALQVQYSFSVAYHPQSNGVVERTNRTVKDALAALARQAPQWLYSSACCAPRPGGPAAVLADRSYGALWEGPD